MNHVSTYTYGDQTVSWLVPDPAEQFSNPYLAMANNPVMYVDPDGEFALLIAGAVVGAYIGGAMANDHLNPGKWDFQDPNTWIGIGVGGTIGAFGGHSLMAAKGKAAFAGMSKGSETAVMAGKKFFGSTVGGTTNAISNYDGADSFGWGTLADFGAGFAGSYVGLSTKSWAAGFNAGGFANAVSNIAQDGFGSAYEFAQDWVGGGLSSMVGFNYGSAIGKASKIKSFGKNFLKYGSQTSMWDFAYTDWEDYRKKTLVDHLTLFSAGGIGGGITKGIMDNNITSVENSGIDHLIAKGRRGFSGILSSAIDFSLQGYAKSGKFPYLGGSQPNKAGILSMKWFLNQFTF